MSDVPASAPTRRHFLMLLGGAATLAACSSDEGASEATGDIAAGNVSALAIDTLRVVPGQPVVLGRDAGGVYAMSTVCTHEQCDMRSNGSISNTGMSCSCHGSAFDAHGNVTQGPAGSPVKHMSVEIADDGAITVHADVGVSVDTRTPVPAT